MDYNILYYTLLVNIVTHIILMIINIFKANQDTVTLYKIVSYFMTFTINVIIYTIILYEMKLLTNTILILYILLTIMTLIIHYILDDDNLFRFNKILTFFTSIVLVILLYSIYSIIVFV